MGSRRSGPVRAPPGRGSRDSRPATGHRLRVRQTDRYVLTGEQPHPHETPADAMGDVDLVERYAAMAGAIGWTRGALVQAGLLAALAELPAEQRVTLPNGSVLLGVHASPGHDDGPGIDSRISDNRLTRLLAHCGGTTIVGGHTHDPTDRMLGSVRALNAGSVGVPRRCRYASWLLLDADTEGLRPNFARSPSTSMPS